MMEEYETEEAQPRGSLEFVESSILDTIVPAASDLNIEASLSGSVERLDEGNDSPLAAIPQRQALFFDETVNVYVVLQTPYFDERTLRSYLGRLVISLEAQVVNSRVDGSTSPPGQEVIYNGSVQDSEDPLIIVQGPDETDPSAGEGHILIVWKMSAFLVRPRLRLHNPSIIFSAIANLKPAEQVQNSTLREEYLPSQVPSGINLLEAFSDDPEMGGIKPRLSALRVSRVAPTSQVIKDMMRPLKNISRQSIKVVPAINARVRYTRPNTTPSNPTVIASVDVDITPFANCEVTLEKVDLNIVGGNVDDLNAVSGMALPMTSLPQDDITFLYRLCPDDLDATNRSQVRSLEISIQATARLSSVCQPNIKMQWTTSLDFTPPVNPGFGNPTQPIQRPHRPAQLSIGSTLEATASSLAISRPDALPSIDITTRHQRNSSIPDFGVTMTFTGPSVNSPIYPGIPFTWSVFIVNRSDRPRKLALLVIPKRRRTETRITRPPSTGYGGSRKDPQVADAVVDENIIYAMQKNSAVEDTEIVCLSTDVRVGPLAPSACYDVELKFMALKVGIVGVEAVRVIDLGTQEHVDIKDLPSIVVSPLKEDM
ncbi:TRAPP trafficking subunit Trs65-domain-containing protein [Cadophora sp. MPI-SDFR-AT-0126]|nr:TRAPP trafficking subunit Trs65-domain-containing protein [Leotiomycetes sp. MPI-SDFR-AT-0126]